jgi:hypothetical protein
MIDLIFNLTGQLYEMGKNYTELTVSSASSAGNKWEDKIQEIFNTFSLSVGTPINILTLKANISDTKLRSEKKKSLSRQ